MSSSSYYDILELSKDCTNEDLSNAYRRLSLKFHPKRNSTKDFAINNYQFHLIAEAFTVLSSSSLRGVYDVYGKDGLINGVLDKRGNLKGGFKYSGNAFHLFENFFGTVNPFTLIKDGQLITDEYGSMFGNGFGGLKEMQPEPTPDLKINFMLSLNDIYQGGVKTLFYERNVLNEDKRTTAIKESNVDIEIVPGIEENKVFVFPGLGNEFPGKKSSDLIVTVKSKKHSDFIRNNSDLICTCKISLVDALNSAPLRIVTLDNRVLNITIDEIISPQTVKKVSKEGLPISSSVSKIFNKGREQNKGDLYIKFDIQFPVFIENEKREELIELLK